MNDAPVTRPDLDALQVVADTLDHHELGNAASLVRDAVTALVAERARADQAEHAERAWRRQLGMQCDTTQEEIERADAAEARADRAEQRIADAPHDMNCVWHNWGKYVNSSPAVRLTCTCWKSATPTAEQ